MTHSVTMYKNKKALTHHSKDLKHRLFRVVEPNTAFFIGKEDNR